MICFSKCVPIWQFTFFITFLGAGVLLILSMFLLHLTLVRRVRNALPEDKIYDSMYDIYFGLWRPIMFGYASVIPFYNNLPQFRDAYDDMDIRAFANRFEKGVACLMIISGLIIILCTIAYFITKWLGIINWNWN